MDNEIIIGIYKIQNIVNNKVYIGQSINVYKRWEQHIYHLNHNTHYNIYLQNAWNKYGPQNFKFEIIQICNSREELNTYETYWKDYYYPQVYNLGSTGKASNISSQTKRKISRTLKLNNSLLSKEERSAKFGNLHNTDRKIPVEVRNKISQTLKGRSSYIRTLDTLIKQNDARNKYLKKVVCFDLNKTPLCIYNSLSEAARALKCDESAIMNCCKGYRKRVHNFIFKYISDVDSETIEKLKLKSEDPFKHIVPIHYKYEENRKDIKTRKRNVNQFDLDMNFIQSYNSIAEASKQTGCTLNGISHCCRGLQKSTKGYIFKYTENKNNIE